MYQLIALKKEHMNQTVKPFWVVKTYKTRNGALRAFAKHSNKSAMDAAHPYYFEIHAA